jgi:hypothetical protein
MHRCFLSIALPPPPDSVLEEEEEDDEADTAFLRMSGFTASIMRITASTFKLDVWWHTHPEDSAECPTILNRAELRALASLVWLEGGDRKPLRVR